MDNLSFKIKKQERQDSVIASDWLRANGLNESYFASVKLIFIQAQQVASNLLTQHRAELNVNELRSLQIASGQYVRLLVRHSCPAIA